MASKFHMMMTKYHMITDKKGKCTEVRLWTNYLWWKRRCNSFVAEFICNDTIHTIIIIFCCKKDYYFVTCYTHNVLLITYIQYNYYCWLLMASVYSKMQLKYIFWWILYILWRITMYLGIIFNWLHWDILLERERKIWSVKIVTNCMVVLIIVHSGFIVKYRVLHLENKSINNTL